MRAAAALLLTAALLSACATRPVSKRVWSVISDPQGATLAYGLRGGAHDFSVNCDLPSKTADLVFHVGKVDTYLPGARTELLIGAGEQGASLPAEVRAAEGEGLVVIARTLLPPAPVAEWVGKRVTVAAVGVASTFQEAPSRAQVQSFLQGCAG
jgi:hypothetical protein